MPTLEFIDDVGSDVIVPLGETFLLLAELSEGKLPVIIIWSQKVILLSGHGHVICRCSQKPFLMVYVDKKHGAKPWVFERENMHNGSWIKLSSDIKLFIRHNE